MSTEQSKLILIKGFIETMDIRGLKKFLPDNITYQELPKKVFTERLHKCFRKFKRLGDTQLIAIPARCNTRGCTSIREGFCFIGNNSKNYMYLVIHVQDEVLMNIHECGHLDTYVDRISLNNLLFVDEATQDVVVSKLLRKEFPY
jgi:hypothetical protein